MLEISGIFNLFLKKRPSNTTKNAPGKQAPVFPRSYDYFGIPLANISYYPHGNTCFLFLGESLNFFLLTEPFTSQLDDKIHRFHSSKVLHFKSSFNKPFSVSHTAKNHWARKYFIHGSLMKIAAWDRFTPSINLFLLRKTTVIMKIFRFGNQFLLTLRAYYWPFKYYGETPF